MKVIRTVTLSRKTLYEELWTLGKTKVAEKYKITAANLEKVCKDYNIPRPSNTYWGKLYAGQDISKFIIPLEESEQDNIEVPCKCIAGHEELERIRREKTVLQDDVECEEQEKEIMANRLSFLPEDEVERIIDTVFNKKKFEDGKLHFKIVQLKKDIENWKNRARQDRREYYNYSTRQYVKEPRFVADITEAGLPRLYRLLDLIFKISESLGAQITEDCCILIGKDRVRFEIIERLKKVNHEITKAEARELLKYEDEIKNGGWASKPQIRKYDYLPTGIFRIKTSDQKQIRDSDDVKLEEKTPDIFLLFYEKYFEEKQKREEYEEKERLRQESYERQQRLQERIEEEKNKLEILYKELEDYQLAIKLRDYVYQLSQLSERDEEYIQWILDKADWIDPLVNKEDSLLGKRERNINKKKETKPSNYDIWNLY